MGCDETTFISDAMAFKISIHAPTWGATIYLQKDPLLLCDFNPRTHMGCDYRPVINDLRRYVISIHAPTWGATND